MATPRVREGLVRGRARVREGAGGRECSAGHDHRDERVDRAESGAVGYALDLVNEGGAFL